MQGSISVVPVEGVGRDTLGLVNRLRSGQLQPDAADLDSGPDIDLDAVAAAGRIVQGQDTAIGQALPVLSGAEQMHPPP